jgi:hypothetical protein
VATQQRGASELPSLRWQWLCDQARLVSGEPTLDASSDHMRPLRRSGQAPHLHVARVPTFKDRPPLTTQPSDEVARAAEGSPSHQAFEGGGQGVQLGVAELDLERIEDQLDRTVERVLVEVVLVEEFVVVPAERLRRVFRREVLDVQDVVLKAEFEDERDAVAVRELDRHFCDLHTTSIG